MIPTWAVFVIVLVIVLAYFLLSNAARQRRKMSVTSDFAKMPDFHANQVFTDVRGEAAIGIDDRGRRIAVARRHVQPRTKFYSFAHIVSAEIIQNGKVIASTGKVSLVGVASGPGRSADAGQRPEKPGAGAAPAGSLFGVTARGVGGTPVIRPAPGPMNMLGLYLVLEGESDPGVLLRFYQGKPVDVESVTGEKAFADARGCLNALDVAIKRAGLPPRPAISGRGLGRP